MITIKLTAEQAGLIITAIDAEIAKGAGTFLDKRAVEQLGAVANQLNHGIESYFLAVEAQ